MTTRTSLVGFVVVDEDSVERDPQSLHGAIIAQVPTSRESIHVNCHELIEYATEMSWGAWIAGGERTDAMAEDGIGPVYLRGDFRMDYDVGETYRLTSMAVGLGALSALSGSLRNKKGLTARERLIGAVAGAGYLGFAAIGVVISPSHVPAWFQRRPPRSQAMSLLPLVLVGVTGGASSPMYRLSVIGVATATGMRERRRETQLIGVLAWGVWCAQARCGSARGRAEGADSVRQYATRLAAYVLASRLAPAATLVAYDTRALVGHLFAFTYERADLAPYQQQIEAALKRTRDAARDAAGAKPVSDVDSAHLSDDALAGLGRLEERLGTLELAGLSDLNLDRLFGAMGPWRHDEMPQTTILIEASELRTRLQQRADVFADLPGGLPQAAVAVEPDVVVRGLSRLALLAAMTTTVAANAARHATQPVTQVQIDLRQRGPSLEMVIATDGSPTALAPGTRERRVSGLAHLRRKLEDFGGTLDITVTGDGVFTVSARLPADTEPEGVGFWSEDISTQIEKAVNDGTLIAAGRSALTALLQASDSNAERKWTSSKTTMAYAGLPIASEILACKGKLRHHRIDTEALVLVINALLTYRAAARGEGITTTWTSGFASRYALGIVTENPRGWRAQEILPNAVRARSQERVLVLTLLNLGAMALGARRRRSGLSADDIVTVMLTPVLSLALLRLARPHVELFDHAISERLAEVESLYELADSYHKSHAAPPKLRPLPQLVDDEKIAEALRHGLFAIEQSEKALRERWTVEQAPVETNDPLARLGRRLRRDHPKLAYSPPGRWIWPKPRSYHDSTIGLPKPVRLGHYMANALGRRIWPARIKLEFDESTLEYLPDAGLQSAAFRRKAVAALDLTGRELNHLFGRGIHGTWNLRQVDLRISVIEPTGSIECELRAWAPPAPRWRTAVDRLHDTVFESILHIGALDDRVGELRSRLGLIDASLVTWDPYKPDRYDRRVTVKPPSKWPSRPSIERGRFVIQLHPQQYAATTVALQRRREA